MGPPILNREECFDQIEVNRGLPAAVKALHHTLGDIAAVLGLRFGTEGFLVLGFPQRTAVLAGRVLAGVSERTI